jgi:hypothetical protein
MQIVVAEVHHIVQQAREGKNNSKDPELRNAYAKSDKVMEICDQAEQDDTDGNHYGDCKLYRHQQSRGFSFQHFIAENNRQPDALK